MSTPRDTREPECFLTTHLPVRVRPPWDNGIELAYPLGWWAGEIPLEDATELGQSAFDGLLRWFDNPLAVVLTNLLSPEVKTVLDVPEVGLLG